MKVSCPNCQKVLQAPDDSAGQKVKCPGCKSVFALPAPPKASKDAAPKTGLDLDNLAALEDAGEAIYAQRKGKRMTVAQAEAARATEEPDQPAAPVDPTVRICPNCGQKVKADDIYSEVECRHCGSGIPGVDLHTQTARYTSGMMDRIHTQVSFYTGFSSAFAYPIPATMWILIGMFVALVCILLPVGVVLAFTAGAGLNPIAGKADLGWVGPALAGLFVVTGIYFGSVAYHLMIDTIRTTSAGGEQPPSLTWNPASLGAALGGYAALLGFYALVVFLLMLMSNDGHVPGTLEELGKLARPGNLIFLAILTFGVPMNMIGLSSSHALDGLNPVRTFRSIGHVAGAYIFLFLIMLIYLGMYVGGVCAVMTWAGPVIMAAAQKGMDVGLLRMLGGPAAWSGLIGLGFYFAYSIGRILGLFGAVSKNSWSSICKDIRQEGSSLSDDGAWTGNRGPWQRCHEHTRILGRVCAGHRSALSGRLCRPSAARPRPHSLPDRARHRP